ncbi:hypothetical protein PLICRDRAFT_424512 [Plicaturopsis crispa FD-325 SS-3]|nr:hypothetical protein PLICRDRAFT_424512 [Plicaturopsis crispa FD-325 SS-3]
MSSAYEKQRLANIARNKALLASLGLDEPAFKPKEKPRAPKPKTKKRKLPVSEESEENGDESASKVSRADSCDDASGRRRSQRNAGKVIDYNAVQAPRLPAFASPGAQKRNERGTSPSRKVGTRQHDPKTFGAIPGIKIGTWWEKREECSADSIHAPWVAGISGGDQGAYSIALSGGYEDDVDMGYAFTYTGSGGRDLKGTANNRKNLRTAPQSSNQSFENSFNKALKISSETKKPVRVIRGYKLKSRYAPSEGYRYDGLYRVEKVRVAAVCCTHAAVLILHFLGLDGERPE